MDYPHTNEVKAIKEFMNRTQIIFSAINANKSKKEVYHIEFKELDDSDDSLDPKQFQTTQGLFLVCQNNIPHSFLTPWGQYSFVQSIGGIQNEDWITFWNDFYQKHLPQKNIILKPVECKKNSKFKKIDQVYQVIKVGNTQLPIPILKKSKHFKEDATARAEWTQLHPKKEHAEKD